jgi:hypothetical protein
MAEEAYNGRVPGPVARFLALSRSDRRLLLRAALLLAAARLGVVLLRLERLRRLAGRVKESRARPGVPDPAYPARVGWAVTAAGRRLGATCLAQALVAQHLLHRRGHAADLRIGFARRGGPGLEGHAWVESGGIVIVGQTDLSRYTPLGRLARAAGHWC